MNEIAREADILFVTLDSLRYDVADKLFSAGKTPNFNRLFPSGWSLCHSPGSFTYAAHQAFFAGFLPTPAYAPKTPRLFAAHFSGSETTTEKTLVFDTPDIVTGFARLGFKTVCIGGVGFFNKQTALGKILPSLFEESYWDASLGVTDPQSTRHQFELAAQLVASANNQPLFLFINVSAIHQPNYFYQTAENNTWVDTLLSHGAALEYVDSQLPVLLKALQKKQRDTFCIFCSDHGTAYGENGYYGHRVAHQTVWDVPMATALLKNK
jgi:hypothetical protein